MLNYIPCYFKVYNNISQHFNSILVILTCTTIYLNILICLTVSLVILKFTTVSLNILTCIAVSLVILTCTTESLDIITCLNSIPYYHNMYNSIHYHFNMHGNFPYHFEMYHNILINLTCTLVSLVICSLVFVFVGFSPEELIVSAEDAPKNAY